MRHANVVLPALMLFVNVVAAGCTSITAAFAPPTPTPTATPTETPTPTPTFTPTPVPPTPTPMPSLSDADLRWLVDMALAAREFQDAAAIYDRQYQLYVLNPVVVQNPTWRFNVTSALEKMRSSGVQMQRNAELSPRLHPLRALFVSLGTDLVAFSDNATAAINGDANRLATANHHLSGILLTSQKISTELQRLTTEYGQPLVGSSLRTQ